MKGAWLCVLVLALGADCTKSNPAATCPDGTCSDPNFPFCDVDGEIGGAPGTCITVTCDSGSIGGCQGSDELVCSATGATYVTKACANGCDPIAGCLECAPNQSVCTSDGNFQTCDANGSATTTVCPQVCDATSGCLACQPSSVTCTADGSAVQTCDGSGNVASTDACTLGCGGGGSAHCLQLVPSNGLGTYLDMVPNPVDISLANGLLDFGSDSVQFFSNSGGNPTTIAAFRVAAPPGGVPLVVVVGHQVTLNGISIVNDDPQVTGGLGPAMVFLATSDIEVTGRVSVETGAISIAGCNGSVQNVDSSGAEPHQSGGGGGGNATNGADGGGIGSSVTGAIHGNAAGSDDLVPLKGGCPGGSQGQLFGGTGGGAVQLVSLSAIRVAAQLVVDANVGASSGGFGVGGGAGGAILLEAPTLTLEGSAALLARGGGGYSGGDRVGSAADDGSPIAGGACGSNQSFCGSGGRGGTLTSPPLSGGSVADGPSNVEMRAGGGGGAVGRIRINTYDGTFAQVGGAVIAGSITTGHAGSK